jgi:hypothetical protein
MGRGRLRAAHADRHHRPAAAERLHQPTEGHRAGRGARLDRGQQGGRAVQRHDVQLLELVACNLPAWGDAAGEVAPDLFGRSFGLRLPSVEYLSLRRDQLGELRVGERGGGLRTMCQARGIIRNRSARRARAPL